MKPIGLYIHIPFCEQKCPYCDFFSKCDKTEYDNYTQNLIRIITDYSTKYNRKVDTVYFGGGTPSVLGTERLCSILGCINKSFDVIKGSEVTLEVNPCSASFLDFKKLFEAGFNRLSIGLQSSDENELKLLGRRYTPQLAKETVKRAKNAGFKNISLDLMLCVPGQTKRSLTESIKFCKDCDVEHISSYILKIEENTPFYKIKDDLDVFSDEQQAQMYIHVVNELERFGYMQYEISNFSKPGFEGQHNIKYWHDEEYIGIGPSAHSFVDGKRFYYSRSIETFYDNITIDDGDGGDTEEYIMLSLRIKEGLDLKKLLSRFNVSINDMFIKRVKKLESEGFLTFENDVVALTKNGFLVSNTIINYLIDAL